MHGMVVCQGTAWLLRLAFDPRYCAFRCSYVFVHFLHPFCLSSFICVQAVLCIHECGTQHSEALQKLQQRAACKREALHLPSQEHAGKVAATPVALEVTPRALPCLLKEENATKTLYLANNTTNKSTSKSTLQKGASSALKFSCTTIPMKEAVTP